MTGDKILEKVRHFGTEVPFSAHDLADLGSRAAVDQALSRLTRQGKLHRLGRGLYLYPRVSRLTGTVRWPTEKAVAQAIARKKGERIAPSRPYASNLLGLSTQVPAHCVFITDGRTRSVRIGPYTIHFRHAEPSTLAAGGRVAPVVFQALRDLGRDRVTDQDVRRLRRLLPPADREEVGRKARYAPLWMRPHIEAIAAPREGETDG